MVEIEIASSDGTAGRSYPRHVLTADLATFTILTVNEEAIALQRLIERTLLDDALICGRYRLEYLYLRDGLRHYRLYAGVHCLGFVDINSDRLTSIVQRYLALYLTALGWSAARTMLHAGGAVTPLFASKRRVPMLFRVNVPATKKKPAIRARQRRSQMAFLL